MKNIAQYKVIGRGKASWHADAGTVEHGNISGGGTYTTRESSNGGTLEKYTSEAVEGCLVYDADSADSDAFINHVYNGPMVDVDLPKGHYRPALSDKSIPLNIVSAGEFAALYGSDEERILSSIDHIALDVFEQMIRKIPGMRIGRVVKKGRSKKVVWEDPANEPVGFDSDNPGSADC